MKSTIAAIGTMAVAVLAQDLSSLAICGRTCISEMLGKAGELGCDAGNGQCLCLAPDFSYGIRDCTNESCVNADDAATAQSWAVDYCGSFGVLITSSGREIMATSTGEANPSATSLVVPSVTSTFTTTISSGSVVSTSTGVTTAPGTTTILTTEPSDNESSSSVTSTETTETTATTTTTGPSGTTTEAPEDTDVPDPASRATAPIGILAVAGIVAFLL